MRKRQRKKNLKRDLCKWAPMVPIAQSKLLIYHEAVMQRVWNDPGAAKYLPGVVGLLRPVP